MCVGGDVAVWVGRAVVWGSWALHKQTDQHKNIHYNNIVTIIIHNTQ